MSYTVKTFRDKDAISWDEFVNDHPTGTFLHTRSFLSYHGLRFDDLSFMIFTKEDVRLVGVLPGVLSENNCYISHPGATFGGLLLEPTLPLGSCVYIFEAIISKLLSEGCSQFKYKSVPYAYRSSGDMRDEYLLWRFSATQSQSHISSVIDLQKISKPSGRRLRGLKKAVKNKLSIKSDKYICPSVWGVLKENLSSRHGVTPVHSLEEINLLANRFPDNIKLYSVVNCGGEGLAYTITFNDNGVFHCQYIFSSPNASKTGAVDFLYLTLIEHARELGFKFFSFGTSTENDGKVINEGLLTFKMEFGAQIHLNNSFTIDLAPH